MPLQIIRNDITCMQVDAIVNAANRRLLGGGGVDGAIHRAAGPQLLEECKKLGGCQTGHAKITRGYQLPAKYVIHTVGPVWHGGLFGERAKLRSCYLRSLALAQKHGCQSVAFPLISAGAYGYPTDKALKTAMDAISAFLLRSDADMQVYLVLYDKTAIAAGGKLLGDVQHYIDDHYVEDHFDFRRERKRAMQAAWEEEWPEEFKVNDGAPAPGSAFSDFGFGHASRSASGFDDACCDMGDDIGFDMDDTIDMPVCEPTPPPEPICASAPAFRPFEASKPISLEEALGQIDESFSQMVLRKIKEKGMKNAECYKKANLDKKLFSKINNDIHYKPKKQTALALAIALELDLMETRELLMKAGLAISHSEKFDIIVEYFIKEKNYDIFEINEVLFYYDQPLLGCVVA